MNWLGGLLLVFAPLAGADNLPVFDKDFPCTDSAKANQYVADFKVDIATFGNIELCNPAIDSKKLFNDLELIEQGKFVGTQSNTFIRDFVPANNYYEWMKSETYGMQRGNDDPTAVAYNSMGYFTMQDGWSKSSTLGRVGTVIHEARHTEGYGHTICTHGPYQDTSLDACDESVDESGAHAVEMEYYSRVALQGANFHPAYQEMARLMLLARANFVFNANPMAEHDGLLALTDKDVIRIDANKTTHLPLPSGMPEGVTLKRTSFGATLFRAPGEAWALDLMDANPQASLQDDYSYFKLLKMTPPSQLQDLEEVDLGTRRYFFAGDQSGHVFSYIYGVGSWSQAGKVGGFQQFHTLSPDGHEGIFATLTGGTYCEVDSRSLQCKGSTLPWPAHTRNLVKFRGEVVSLGEDGVVRRSDGTPLPELQGVNVSSLVSVPQYNAFE